MKKKNDIKKIDKDWVGWEIILTTMCVITGYLIPALAGFGAFMLLIFAGNTTWHYALILSFLLTSSSSVIINSWWDNE